MKAIPKIYLQSMDGELLFDTTWCQDKINPSDIEYLSKDEVRRLLLTLKKSLFTRSVIKTQDDIGIFDDLVKKVFDQAL